jgi:hypothetical protein
VIWLGGPVRRLLRLTFASFPINAHHPLSFLRWYVAIINKTLRDVAMYKEAFSFEKLERLLDNDTRLQPNQKNLLEMRFDLLKSFMMK